MVGSKLNKEPWISNEYNLLLIFFKVFSFYHKIEHFGLTLKVNFEQKLKFISLKKSRGR